MATMAFTFLAGVAGEGLIILIHGTQPPTDLEWAVYVRELVKHDPRELRNLVFTDGGAPSGAQRKQVNDFLKGRASPAVVVSGSYMVRGVVNTLSWFNPQVRAYAPDELPAALRYIGVRDQEVARVNSEVQVLRQQLQYGTMRSNPV
jgi:hypothetical protein